MNSDSQPTLSFTAHALVQAQGSDSLPRASADPDCAEWHLHWDVYMAQGPPPNTLGVRSDLWFDGCKKIFFRGETVWTQWDRQPGTRWPQKPRAHHANTKDYYLVQDAEKGVYYRCQDTGSPSPPTSGSIIRATIRRWDAYFQAHPGDTNSKDIALMVSRLEEMRQPPDDAGVSHQGQAGVDDDVDMNHRGQTEEDDVGAYSVPITKPYAPDHCADMIQDPTTPTRSSTDRTPTLSPVVPLPEPVRRNRSRSNTLTMLTPSPSPSPEPAPPAAPCYDWHGRFHNPAADNMNTLLYQLRAAPDALTRGRIGTECPLQTHIVTWASRIQTVLPPAPDASVLVPASSFSLTGTRLGSNPSGAPRSVGCRCQQPGRSNFSRRRPGV